MMNNMYQPTLKNVLNICVVNKVIKNYKFNY